MPEFQKKPMYVTAHQWFKNGDHPDDDCKMLTDETTGQQFLSEGKVVRHYRHPDIDGRTGCYKCAKPLHEHGWLDASPAGNRTVCPGDWIETVEEGKYRPVRPNAFRAENAPLEGDWCENCDKLTSGDDLLHDPHNVPLCRTCMEGLVAAEMDGDDLVTFSEPRKCDLCGVVSNRGKVYDGGYSCKPRIYLCAECANQDDPQKLIEAKWGEVEE